MYIDGETISSNLPEIGNFLNKHLTTVAAKTDSKIVKTNENFSFYLKNPNKKTFSQYPTTPAEVGYKKIST